MDLATLTARGDEIAFLENYPRRMGTAPDGGTILRAGQFLPGNEAENAGLVVLVKWDQGDYSTHVLVHRDDRIGLPMEWVLMWGHYHAKYSDALAELPDRY